MGDIAAIDRLVLAQLHSRLRDGKLGEVTPEVEKVALEVLHEGRLTGAEEALLEEQALEEHEDPIGALLGERIDQALLAGLDAAGADAETVRPTEILVLRSSDGKQLGSVLKRLRQHIAERMKGGENQVLLVAGKQLYSKVKQLIPAGRVGGMPTVEFHEDGTVRSDTTAAIEVVSADVEIEDIEALATQRISEIRGDSVDADSMAAAWNAADEDTLASLNVSGTNGSVQKAVPLEERVTIPVPQADSDADPMLGTLFHKKYRIIRQLGKGGFGSVYEATDERGAGNRVAIKVLSGKAAESAAQQQSFKDEARRVTRLSHPNIVDWKVFDETDDGVPYFVMELVAGEEFEDTLRRERKIAPDRVAMLLLQVVDALRAAHHLSKTQSILHLDLKPANLFRIPPRTGREEQLKVIDFGIGQFIGDERVEGAEVLPAEDLEPGDLEGPSTLTFSAPAGMVESTGGVTRSRGCTPEYASPEQCAHVMFKPDIVALDGRSDLYSLGVMAFEMLTGQLPFKAKSRLDIMRMHLDDEAPAIGSMGVKIPRKLARFVDRCLEKDRDKRWRNTQEAYQFLHEIVHPPVWKTVAKVMVPVVLVALAIGGWMWSTRDVIAPTAGLATAEGLDPATQPLVLGPARTSTELLVTSDENITRDASEDLWRVVRTSDGQDSELWTARWSAEERVEIAAIGAQPGREYEPVELWLGDDTLRSRPIDMVWIGPEAWSLDTERVLIGDRVVEDLKGMQISPAGLRMDVDVLGEASGEIETVSLATSGQTPMNLSPDRADESKVRFSMNLGATDVASLPDGPRTYELSVTDAAGRTVTRSFELDLVRTRLSLSEAKVLDASAGGESSQWPPANRRGPMLVFGPNTLPALQLQLMRRADLEWRVFKGQEDRPVMSGHINGKLDFELVLEGLTDMGGGKPFDGRLEIDVDEAAYVLHSRDSATGHASKTFAFQYENSLPTFLTAWRGESDTSVSLVGGDERSMNFTNTAAGEILLTRKQPVPMDVEVDWWRSGSEERMKEPVRTLALRNEGVQQAKLPVSLAADGLWLVRVRSFRYDRATKQKSALPDVEVTYPLSLDRAAPTPSLVGLQAGHLVSSADSAPQDFAVQFDDAAREGDAAVDLSWVLKREGNVHLTGEVTGHDPLTGEATLGLGESLRESLLDTESDSDGAYLLTVNGIDQAGNALPEARLEFTVATTGPAVVLEEPSGTRKWRRNAATRQWQVRARAADPNGIREVHCSLVSGDFSTPVKLSREEGSSASEWSLIGSMALPYTLSEASVFLSFESEDEYGSTRKWQSQEFDLPVITRPEPDRIAVAFEGHEVEPMRLVRGNSEFQYLFGGRGDEVENPDFVEAGLGEFNSSPRSTRSRSWQIPFPAGSIPSYYLDEHEVSVAQFRSFLEASSGYSNSKNWPSGHHPDSTLQQQLLASCQNSLSDAPMTGVSWAEASAYATWVGKRLPSWVEWEYAVRGGAEYRPFAGYNPEAREAVVVAEASATLAPRTSARWDASQRFADLSSNVAEWTSSGILSGEADGAYPHQWAGEDTARLLPRDEVAPEYWVAGSHFGKDRVDFSVADLRNATSRSSTIGFRCAIELTTVQDRLGVSLPGQPSIEERP